MTEVDILSLISESSEFEYLKSRQEEMQELKELKTGACFCQIKVILIFSIIILSIFFLKND
jgi:hypothetical protein